MKRLILSLALLLVSAAPGAAQQTKSQLNTEVSTNLPDNTTGLITPAILRTTLNDFIASWQQAPRVNAQTGTTYTFVVGDYGYLVTFNNASPVAVTLPQATGSFATWNVQACSLGAGTVTITPVTSSIGGNSSLTLQQNQCRLIVSDGTNYQLSASSIKPVTCSASNWINAISGSLVPTCSQPAFTDISGTAAVTQGGTGLVAGTSGGIPYFSSPTTMGSSLSLTLNGVVLGAGGGGAPTSTLAGTNGQLLVGQSAAAPLWKTIAGDVALNAAGTATVATVNGVAYPASPSTSTVPVVTSSNQVTYQAVPNAALANSTITLNAGTNTGLTAPGSVALGGTGVIGSTSDTPRFAGMGLGGASNTRGLRIYGATSGFTNFDVASIAGSGTITWPAGTTDFSATGGASNVVKQTSAGAAFTVAQLSFSDIASVLGASQVGTTTITGQTVNNSPSTTNDYFLYYSAADNAVRRCTIGSCTSAGVAGVSSLNGLTGGLSVVAGTGIGVSASGTSVTVSLSSARQTNPTSQRFTSGSGTYTTPSNVLWIEIYMVGAGGGGASGGNGASGGAGGNTCWNTSGSACTSPVYQAGGGAGGGGTGQGGTGGVIAGSGTCTDFFPGGGGQGGSISTSGTAGATGGIGGSSTLGGGGGGSGPGSAGTAGSTNTGGGGQGGGMDSTSTLFSGGGGGSGASCMVIINGPAATYTYAIGAAGTGNTSPGSGGSNGGAGAAGRILVIEHYGS